MHAFLRLLRSPRGVAQAERAAVCAVCSWGAGADAAEVGGQVGVAVVTLVKEHSEFAVPLLTRAVEADREAGGGGSSSSSSSSATEGRDAELVYYLAYAHGRKGRRAEAVALLEEVLRIDPAHADANKMLPLLQR